MKRPEAAKRQPGRRSAAESRDTRERLLAAAEKHFARYGYSGTSIRDLGSALGIASSSVLYHVGSKRKLYALVLQRISDSLSSVLHHIEDGSGADMMQQFAERLMSWSELHPYYVQILVHEMMENPDRLGEVHRWLLAGFMQDALGLSARATARQNGNKVDADMVLMLILGAVINFHISLPTFMALRGTVDRLELKRRFMDTLDQFLSMALSSPRKNIKSGSTIRTRARP
jgi:TetR/AcrR family transcriptional regulator